MTAYSNITYGRQRQEQNIYRRSAAGRKARPAASFRESACGNAEKAPGAVEKRGRQHLRAPQPAPRQTWVGGGGKPAAVEVASSLLPPPTAGYQRFAHSLGTPGAQREETFLFYRGKV